MSKNKENALKKLKDIATSEKYLPKYSLLDFYDLQPSDFLDIYKILNGKITFKKLLEKDFLGNIFFKILNTCELLNEGGITKTDLIAATRTDLSKVMSDNLLLFDSKLWYKGKGWELVDVDISKVDLENFIRECFFVPGIVKISISDMDKIAKSVVNGIYKNNSDNNIYQFNNYYIEDGDIKIGTYQKSLPKFILPYNIDIDKNTKLPKEVYELISHLCGHNKDAIETLLDHMSMALCNDFDMRQALAKAVYLYGKTGENGKSTFLNFVSDLIISENTHSITDLSDKSDRFQAMNSMVALFPDAEKYWGTAESEFIKQGVTSDKMSGRDLYKSAVSKRYSFSVFIATNHLIKAEDKSDALFRRLLVISCNEKLRKEDEWFEVLKSKETLNDTMNFLFNRYKKIRETRPWNLNDFNESKYALEIFRNNADIVYYFVNDLGIDKNYLDYKPTRLIYQEFLEFCYEVGIDGKNILQMNNFNNQLTVVVEDIEQKRVKGSTILNQLGVDEVYCGGSHERNNIKSDDPRSYIRTWDESNHNSTFRCWKVKE